MVQIPLGEWGSIDLNNAVFNESFGSDQLVVRCVVDNVEDSCFTSDSFWGPVKVSLFKSEGSEFVVSSSDTNSADSSGITDEFGVGDGSSFFESSLLLVDRHAATGQSSFVPGVSVNTHWKSQDNIYGYNNSIFININI